MDSNNQENWIMSNPADLMRKAYYACNGIPTGVDEYGPCIPTQYHREQLFNLILSRQSEFLPFLDVARDLLAGAADRNSPGAVMLRTLIAHGEA
jgi:hypothetical protein